MNFKKMKITLVHISVLVSVVILLTAATVYAAALSSDVQIHCDGKVITVEKSSKSVYRELHDNGITIGTFDRVLPGLDISVEDVEKIIVKRAVDVNVEINGVKMTYSTSMDTVEEFLKAKGMPATSHDIVEPALETPITEGMNIKVIRGIRVYTENVFEIPYETIRNTNDALPKDLVSVTRYGENGTRTQTVETIVCDGVEVSSRIVSDVVTKEPVAEILDVGTKENAVIAPDGTVYTYSKMITCTATAYDASYESNGPWGPYSATGKRLDSGMVAVDPRVIPLGTKLYIEAPDGSWVYGYSVAEDTGGAIKGNKVDLFFHSPTKMRQFGRRTANVYILD